MEISGIQFIIVNFFHVLMSNTLLSPNYTDMVRLAESLCFLEPELDGKMLEKLDYIYLHTDSEINIGLAELEMLVFYQLQSGAGLNKEIEINDKSYKIIELYKHLDNVNKQLVPMVVNIMKKYNVDIAVNMGATSRLQM